VDTISCLFSQSCKVHWIISFHPRSLGLTTKFECTFWFFSPPAHHLLFLLLCCLLLHIFFLKRTLMDPFWSIHPIYFQEPARQKLHPHSLIKYFFIFYFQSFPLMLRNNCSSMPSLSTMLVVVIAILMYLSPDLTARRIVSCMISIGYACFFSTIFDLPKFDCHCHSRPFIIQCFLYFYRNPWMTLFLIICWNITFNVKETSNFPFNIILGCL